MSAENKPGPVEDHREREQGVLVYPVFSRRSGGLSLGINLFPGSKHCPFDCPYCEVFPFKTETVFDTGLMERALAGCAIRARESGNAVRDICFSGNGEPTTSPHFPAALAASSRVRKRDAPEAALVVITNGAGLLDGERAALLQEYAAGPERLDVWLKIDAGTPEWYEKINHAPVPHAEILAGIREFAARAPVTVQTMLCAVDGEAPPPEEEAAWERFITETARAEGAAIRAVQLYGKARPAPGDPRAEKLPVSYLEKRAVRLKRAFSRAGINSIPVCVYP
ncbi:MAG: hypothetical protein LBC88_07025 [Spirochaetaceae bacterium]|jgi:histidinol dehydrogenase|nr:hypothetical protein [Spirochaetaceae bacterium]